MSEKRASELMLAGALIAIIVPRALHVMAAGKTAQQPGPRAAPPSADPVQDAVNETVGTLAPAPWFAPDATSQRH